MPVVTNELPPITPDDPMWEFVKISRDGGEFVIEVKTITVVTIPDGYYPNATHDDLADVVLGCVQRDLEMDYKPLIVRKLGQH